MATKPKEPDPPKRLNRAVGVAEALSGVIDSALKKRGFASRDILRNWAAMAPKPYDRVAIPDKLVWPRAAKGHEGATLYLRCAPGQSLALAHESGLVAAAVNRYFGYVLVREVRPPIEPFSAGSPAKPQVSATLPEVAKHAGEAVADIADTGLKDALKGLGEALLSKKRR